MSRMFIAILSLELHIPASNSLKHKRMILNSFKGKLRNNFNISVAEIDEHDKWQKAVIAISHVGGDKRHIDKTMDKILKFAESFNGIDLLRNKMEIL